MNFRFFAITLYFLPTYFFALAYSPNIAGLRIGVDLMIIYLLLLPSLFYLSGNTSIKQLKKHRLNYLFLAIIVSCIFGGGVLINWQFALFLLILSILSIFSFNMVQSGKNWMIIVIISIFMGAIIFSTNYIGLNQYEIDNLLNLNQFISGLFSGILVLFPMTLLLLSHFDKKNIINFQKWVKNKVKLLHWLIRLMLFAFVLYFIFEENARSAGYYVLATIPGYFMLYIVMRKQISRRSFDFRRAVIRINFVNSIAMTLFFAYFFLNKTQVLQAISAGY
jgi:1,4-dihydroxy-2-naphthoate octaprenyltransferase